MIKVTKKENYDAFTQLSMVVVARSRDSLKLELKTMLVDDDTIVCTDSMRLHLVQDPELIKSINLKQGMYEVIKATKREVILEKSTIESNYPEYKMILENQVKDSCIIKGSHTDSKICNLIIDTGLMFRIHQLEDILDFTFDKRITVDYYGEGTSSVHFSDDYGFKAVIMPMRS